MRTLLITFVLGGLSSLSAAQLGQAPTSDTSEWRFNGSSSSMIGLRHGVGELEGIGNTLSTTDQLTTCSAAGLPLINFTDTSILSFGAHGASEGYYLRPKMSAWVGDGPQQMTWVYDLYFESAAGDDWVSLWNRDEFNSDLGDFYCTPSSTGFYVTAPGGGGSYPLDSWFRLVVVQDYPNNVNSIYVNGVLFHTAAAPTYMWNGDVGAPASWFLADCCGFTGSGHIANLAITDELLSAAHVATLGGANAWGVFSPYVDPPGTPGVLYCVGDDSSVTWCPCGNTSDGSLGVAGCANSAFASGCRMTGSGTASVGEDDLVLRSEGMVPHQPCLYFQGDNRVDGGIGISFGDGLRCAGGGVIRLQLRFPDSAGASSTTINIAAKGDVVPGDTKRYQVWYRDPNPFSPCGWGFNLSNGFEVVWGA